MAHTQTKEQNKIVLGSMDFYVIVYTAGMTIPADNEIEVEENMIGRTKNGATITYSAEWYEAVSDDGKARKNKLVGESCSISYGNITWNGNTIKSLTATARVTEEGGKRKVKIGGVANDNGTRYLIRGVYRDKIDGDIRITATGVNTGGWDAAFNPKSEATMQPTFQCEPLLDNEGTLLEYEEEILGLSKLTVTLEAGSTSGKTKVTAVTPAAESGNSLKYKVGASAQTVNYDEVCSSGWTALTAGTTEIAVTSGQVITVVEVDSANKAKKCGSVTATNNIG